MGNQARIVSFLGVLAFAGLVSPSEAQAQKDAQKTEVAGKSAEEPVWTTKIFEVRRIHNDLTFVDEFLTLDFCKRHNMFSFSYNDRSNYYEIESRQFEEVKQQLLFNLTNVGRPIIHVTDGNYKNRGELFLKHDYNGVELKTSYATDTLVNLHRLWGRPVHIHTTLSDQETVLSYDGSHHHSTVAGETPPPTKRR